MRRPADGRLGGRKRGPRHPEPEGLNPGPNEGREEAQRPPRISPVTMPLVAADRPSVIRRRDPSPAARAVLQPAVARGPEISSGRSPQDSLFRNSQAASGSVAAAIASIGTKSRATSRRPAPSR